MVAQLRDLGLTRINPRIALLFYEYASAAIALRFVEGKRKMPLKTILVCLETEDHAATLMKAAIGIARRTGAHLIGLHATEALLVYPGIAMHVPGSVFAEFNASQKEEAARIKAVFEHYALNEDFVSEFRLLQAVSQSGSKSIIESARSADLVIMSQEDQEADRIDELNNQDNVIRDSGRPVLVIPQDYEGPEIGYSLLLGSSETREATRAAHDLLLLAAPDAQVCLLSIGSTNTDELADFGANAMASTYARHGLRATTEHRGTAGKSICETLHDEALEVGADVIVTGAFGHSLSYDFIIGAATRDLLRHATLPVMFSK